MKEVILAVAVIMTSAISLTAQIVTLPKLPQVSGLFTLEAVTDPVSGKSQFRYDGHNVPPVVRVRPGEDIAFVHQYLALQQQMTESLSTVAA